MHFISTSHVIDCERSAPFVLLAHPSAPSAPLVAEIPGVSYSTYEGGGGDLCSPRRTLSPFTDNGVCALKAVDIKALL